MIADILLITMLALPWLACFGLIVSGSRNPQSGRRLVMLTAALLSLGCLTLVILQLEPNVALGSTADEVDRSATMSTLAWSTDRFSLVMVAVTMLILAAAAVLLPDDSSAAWMLTLMILGGVLHLWWLQHVWWIAGAGVLMSFFLLVLPTAGESPGMAGPARSLWLTTSVGDLVLILAIIAGIGGLGDGAALLFCDSKTVGEFAAMRPATGMFVAFWWWIGILGRCGQFPLCVTFDAVRPYRPLAWVIGVAVGVFAVGWRWCDLGHAWWAASPSVFNLVVSGALASSFLCAWFALCTADFRVRVAYLTAAHVSLALGPLCTGSEIDRVWASAVVMGTLGLAVWCWCVVTAPLETGTQGEHSPGPAWAKIMTGGETSTVVWQWSMMSRPTPTPILPTIAPWARSQTGIAVLLWCGLSLAAGSWWWGEDLFAEVVPKAAAPASPERTGDVIDDAVPLRPNGSIPVSALAVALIAASVCAGMRTLVRQSGQEHSSETQEHSVWAILAFTALAAAPTAIIVSFARPSSSVAAIGTQLSPALACLALAALVSGWVWAGWPLEQQQRVAASFGVLQRFGQRRLLVPGLLQFGANFPLRGLAQMFRFLDWSLLEITCWGGLRRLPEVLRRFIDDLRQAGNESYALVVWVSGTALVTTIIWLAQTPR